MKRRKKSDYIWPPAIFVLALALRIWNVSAVGTAFYANTLSDASTYQVWAFKIVNGLAYGEPVFQMGPLYPYFLALSFIVGLKAYSVLILQSIFGALVAFMIYMIARRLYGRIAGIISGFAAALYAPFIFYDGLILSESLQIFLVSISLLLLTWKPKREKWWLAPVAGILIGLTALGRATILFFAAGLMIYWLVIYWGERRRKHPYRHLRMAALFAAGVLLGILPATIHNMAHGDFVLISSNTGINFYIGNNGNSNGTYEEPKGLDLFTDFSGRQIAEKRMGRALQSSDVSSFWTGEAFKDIKANPLRFAWGLAIKALLYLWHYDIAQAESIHIQSYFSPLFRMPLIGFGAVFIFGLAGLLFYRADDKRWILILLLVSNIFGVILFFVLGRFKLLGTLPLLISFGAGAALIWDIIRQRDTARLAWASVVALIGLAILFLPRPLDRNAKDALVFNNVGIYYYFKNDYDGAEKWYRMAAEISDNGSESMNNIGTVFYARDMIDSAAAYFQRALMADPASDKTLLNLGRISLMRGQPDSARYYYQRARAVAPFGTSADEALAELDRTLSADSTGRAGVAGASFQTLYDRAQRVAGMGRYDQAEDMYLAALRIKKDDIAALNNLGFAYQAQKKYPQAAEIFERVLRLSPDNGVAYNNLAGTLYQIGKIDSAIVLWEKAIKLDPSNSQFARNLEFARKKANSQ